ncbi:MAG: hypothetical protein NZU63_08625 [Gemmataceae bacterium]|nr:hypothetical protein [Gemmataceae bacterium]MDW8243148.1 hypothetical protein [Thermogemmata sp.]
MPLRAPLPAGLFFLSRRRQSSLPEPTTPVVGFDDPTATTTARHRRMTRHLAVTALHPPTPSLSGNGSPCSSKQRLVIVQ